MKMGIFEAGERAMSYSFDLQSACNFLIMFCMSIRKDLS